MILYRLAALKYAQDLTGEGSRLYGGRWNLPGTPCIYTAENRALAVLEYSVNVDLHLIPRTLQIIQLQVPDDSITICNIPDLPGNWKDVPAPAHTQRFGSRLLQAKETLMIKVPSTVVPQEFNFLINPLHPGMQQVRVLAIEDFVYDPRIKQ
ncbi:hypothetical protein BUE76_13115 [Cnuella takakiae]|nr:hypothetical protein BUE76_13115 [Cnuella takakiae]